MLLVFPSILNSIKKTKGDLSKAGKELLYNSVFLYLDSNVNQYPQIEGNRYCITVKELLDAKKLESIGLIPNLKETDKVEVNVKEGQYLYELNSDCTSYVYENADSSGANPPMLSSNMVPVKYDGSNWIKADVKNEDGMYQWYDYNHQMWANAVVTNSNLKIKDLSGNGLDGTFRGAKRKMVDGTLAATFDGIDDYIEVPTLPETINWQDGFMIEFEATYDEFGKWSRIFDFGNGQGKKNILMTNGVEKDLMLHVYFMDSSYHQRFQTDLSLKTSTKFTVKVQLERVDTKYLFHVYDQDKIVKTEEYDSGGDLLDNVQRIYNYIGKSNWGTDAYFKGKIYNLKITEASGRVILWYDFTNNDNYIEVNDYTKSNLGTIIPEEDILGYFVWIPRYEYMYTNLGTLYAGGTKEQPGEIGVHFMRGTSSKTSESYKLHPAFTFGSKELTGFWVGKFETSSLYDNTINDVKYRVYIKPNVVSLRKQSLAYQYQSAILLSSFYRLDSSMHSRMMKGSEWGAIAYLSQSQYGKYGNAAYTGSNKEIYQNKSLYITGNSNGTPSGETTLEQCTYDVMIDRGNGMGFCGGGASTTGNIYGIYDMSGGSWEHVLVNYNQYVGRNSDENSFFNGTLGNGEVFSGGIAFPSSSEIDLYTSKDFATACNGICYGQALSETQEWYLDAAASLTEEYPWNCRGASYAWKENAGIFSTSYSSGRATEYTFRVVLSQ